MRCELQRLYLSCRMAICSFRVQPLSFHSYPGLCCPCWPYGWQNGIGVTVIELAEPNSIRGSDVDNECKTTLADELTGNLDSQNRDIIMNLLRHEHEKGRGIILITHDMEIAKAADATYVLSGGVLHT